MASVLCFQRDCWRCVDCGWEPEIVSVFREAGLGIPPVEEVLAALRHAFARGDRHLHADHQIPIESSRSCDSISTTCGHDAMLAIERRLGGSQFGWVQPIVCDREDVIVIGHLRLAAAHFVGLTEVPVHVASNLSPAQIKALRIADNRTHEESDWIEDLLSAALLDLKSLDFDLGLTGFDSREISALIDQPNSAEDEVPPLPAVPVSRLGDLWLLGPHRVLCADSTNANSVARLMGEYGYGGCAFGVVLHELLTGTQACRGETVSDALASVFTMGRRKQ